MNKICEKLASDAIICENIGNLKAFINDQLNIINEKICKRFRALSIKNIIYFIMKKLPKGKSYNSIIALNNFGNICSCTKTAIIKKRKNIPEDSLLLLNNNMLEHIYKNTSNDRRLIAIDSSQLTLPIELKAEGFPLSANKGKCKAKLSSLYDITNNLIVNYSLEKDFNERHHFISQIKLLKPSDIIIADRGYYSKEILNVVNEHGIDCIFRLKRDLDIVKNLIKSKKKRYVALVGPKKIKFHVLSYKIPIMDKYSKQQSYETYYIGTTLSKKIYPIEHIKQLYWKRWGIETNFRFAKYQVGLNNLVSKCRQFVIQDIYIAQMIANMALYNEILVDKYYKKSHEKINHTTNLSLTIKKMLYSLFFNNESVKTILEILQTLLEPLLPIIKGRSYPRISKQPQSKWLSNSRNVKK